jgi:flagellar secretion chaperone FliS
MNSAETYAQNQRITAVFSANSAGLVALVFERILDHLQIAQSQMELNQDTGPATGKAIDLIESGLRTSLDFAQGGQIAENLNAIYTWAVSQIMLARIRKDPAILDQVGNVLQPLALAWRDLANQPMATALVPAAA